MIVEMEIGAFDNEKGRKQKVRVDVVAETTIWPDAAHDNLNETVSYDLLVHHVHHAAQSGHIHLVETLAQMIASACLADPYIKRVTVRVEKLDIYPFATPGVEIVREK